MGKEATLAGRWKLLLLIAVIAGMLVFVIRPAVLRSREEQRELTRMEETYRQAEELYRQGEYGDPLFPCERVHRAL